MSKKITSIFILLAILLLPACELKQSIGSTQQEYYADSVDLQNAELVTCSVSLYSQIDYENNTITHDAPRKNSMPLTFVFSGLKTGTPHLKSVGSAGTSRESQVVTLSETSEKIVLGEVTEQQGNFFSYTIHKNSGFFVWTNVYTLLGATVGTIGTGYCH